jgi:hypothetical protein
MQWLSDMLVGVFVAARSTPFAVIRCADLPQSLADPRFQGTYNFEAIFSAVDAWWWWWW